MIAAEAFRAQARACEALDSPFTGRVLNVIANNLARDTPVGRRILSWPGDISASGDAVPLRLAGALHALVLSKRDMKLAAAWRTPDSVTDAALWSTVDGALRRFQEFVLAFLEHPPQTNEVGRSAALIAVARWLGMPLALSELGASAGLNLLWDRYALEVAGRRYGPGNAPVTLRPDWDGPPPARAAPRVHERAGVDRNPLDPVSDRLRVLAYVWADQTERLERAEAALDAATRDPAPVAKGDAVDWLAERLKTKRPGRLHLVYHTLTWQYLSPQQRERATALLEEAGAESSEDAPLAHFGLENDGDGDGGALTLQLWPGGHAMAMGRADFHGRWLRWRPPDAT